MLTKLEKKILSAVLSILVSISVWGIMEWRDYHIFKAVTEGNMVELKTMLKESQNILKSIEIKVAKIEQKTEDKK